MQYPKFKKCKCEMHSKGRKQAETPQDALDDPFTYLPPPIPFTAEMEVIANRYNSHDIDWRYYPAFQAAAFLQPKSPQRHADRKEQFLNLKQSAESQGFSVPDALTRLFLTDEFIDRLHHNCVWPNLPEQIVRLPSNSEFALFLFLTEGQGCGFWHLLLALDGSHTVVNADVRFGCTSGYPPGYTPDPSQFTVFQCMDTLNRLLYHYFIHSAQHDVAYGNTLERYFSETGAS